MHIAFMRWKIKKLMKRLTTLWEFASFISSGANNRSINRNINIIAILDHMFYCLYLVVWQIKVCQLKSISTLSGELWTVEPPTLLALTSCLHCFIFCLIPPQSWLHRFLLSFFFGFLIPPLFLLENQGLPSWL